MTTLQQRRNYVLASNLLLIGLVVGYLSMIAGWMLGITPIVPLRWPYLLYISTIIAFTSMATLYYAVRFGKRWTRILLLVLVVGGLLMSLAHPEKIKGDPLNVLNWVVYLITHIWGLVLLFKQSDKQAMA